MMLGHEKGLYVEIIDNYILAFVAFYINIFLQQHYIKYIL